MITVVEVGVFRRLLQVMLKKTGEYKNERPLTI